MDPNDTLHELRELVAETNRIRDLLAQDQSMAWTARQAQEACLAKLGLEVAEKFDALDGWMSKGGFAPDAWRETRDHR